MVDALRSGRSESNLVEVRVLSRAPIKEDHFLWSFLKEIFEDSKGAALTEGEPGSMANLQVLTSDRVLSRAPIYSRI